MKNTIDNTKLKAAIKAIKQESQNATIYSKPDGIWICSGDSSRPDSAMRR